MVDDPPGLPTLAVIPSFLRQLSDLHILFECLESIKATTQEGQLDVLVVDDFSPARDIVKALATRCDEMGVELIERPENVGFSQTVNVGLRRAREEGRDAVLINADVVFPYPGWLDLMLKQRSEDGKELASIVGALLLYPSGLIQQAGIFFSVLTRSFGHRYQYGPGDLPEAHRALTCPVTGALQFIRSECLTDLGVYDEAFRLSFEDVSYCIDAWKSGRSVVYQPAVQAVHHESLFRGRGRADKKIRLWEAASWNHFCDKHAADNFSLFVPDLI